LRRYALELTVDVQVVYINGSNQVRRTNQIMTVVRFQVGKVEHAELAKRDQ
jgi:hypothetical protein